MGYFNIFYKITRIIDMLTRKRNRKIIAIILIIISIIFLLHNKGYCATETELNMFYQSFWFNSNTGRIAKSLPLQNSSAYTWTNFQCYYLISGNTYKFEFSGSSVGAYIVNELPLGVEFPTYYSEGQQNTATSEGVYLSAKNIYSGYNMSVGYNLWLLIPTANFSGSLKMYQVTQDVTNNDLQQQTNSITGSITDSTNIVTNTITSSDIPTNEMVIDTSIIGDVSNTENDNVLTNIINKFQGVISPSASVTTITIPIPKTGKSIVLRSDLLSAHISNTIIGTYITIFWYVVFFWYFFKFAYRVINWVVTGEMIEKPSAFMKYLMEQNAIITASMM